MTLFATNARDGGRSLYIGLMSGTSLDGVDAVLADLAGTRPLIRGAVYQAFPPDLRASLLALQATGPDELHRMAMAANALVDCYAAAVEALIAAAGVAGDDVAALGAHGQTVRHRPDCGYTTQINNPARLAERTGITVVADFRARDVAAGGQGAPLVPAFHAALFQDPLEHRVVVNIGGISNITNLPPGLPGAGVTGWDTGPGNVLLDAWCQCHRGHPFDHDGTWAAGGTVREDLLQRLLEDPYFRLPPPKSTGRDLFNSAWLASRMPVQITEQDVQATLLRLTAQAVVADVEHYCGPISRVLVCGGGANNGALMRLLARLMAEVVPKTNGGPPPVQRTDQFGVPVHHVEALAFAWLACRMLHGEPGNLPAVTGARGLRVLGAVYPA